MSVARNRVRRVAVVSGLVGIVVVLAPVAMVLGTMVVNNVRMNDWKQDVFATPIPAGSEVVHRGTDYGLLQGNSNHCDKLAWLELHGAPPDAVEKHFRGLLETDDRWVRATAVDTELVRVEVYEAGENAGWDPRCH